MTNNDDIISALYREASDESTPEHLDHAILAMAKERTPKNWQPFALAATVLLSFAFLVNLNWQEVPIAGAPAEFSDNLSNTADELVREEQSMPAANAPLADAQQVDDFAMRKRQVAAPESTQAPAQARELEEARSQFSDVERGDAVSKMGNAMQRVVEDRACGDVETASPDSWYKCVLDLRARGLDSAANEEQARLLSQHPEFEIR